MCRRVVRVKKRAESHEERVRYLSCVGVSWIKCQCEKKRVRMRGKHKYIYIYEKSRRIRIK